jgi:hypothetical protein
MGLPGLTRDAVIISRPGSTVDAEGNPVAALTEHLDTRGTWGSPSYRDERYANASGQVVDATVAMATADVLPGDFCDVRDKRYRVVAVADARTHMRLLLRRADS